MTHAIVNLDNAAAAPPNPKLAEWYAELLPDYHYNPHGGTCVAERCRRLALEAERRLLALLGIPEREANVIWTSGVTEALNLAAQVKLPPDSTVAIDPEAHPALSEPCKAWANVGTMPCDCFGEVQPNKGRCDLCAVSHINNETGFTQNLPAIRAALGACGGQGLLLVDAAQSFCKTPIPWQAAHIDMLALSSRKIGGPAAVGALVVRKGVNLRAQLVGGGQQNGLRSGTLDAIGVELFVRSAESAMRRHADNGRRVTDLSTELWACLYERSGASGWPNWQPLHSGTPADSPYINLFSFPGHEGAVLARILAERHGVLVSSSSACSAESGRLSPGLLAMGVEESVIRGAMRVSFSTASTFQDLQTFLSALEKTLADY
ncbi:MAG: aminotransferase class V-fold PLP-dependent enzyme [Victivallales bacterium]|nr:aminotransferase class V-fold PLP-dependent enzyme [Victivallales bacterium]